jgi:hypothetical protein
MLESFHATEIANPAESIEQPRSIRFALVTVQGG